MTGRGGGQGHDAAQLVPGGLLLRWPALLAVGALVLNDHVLKYTVAAWWTGKLSGVAGLVLVPLLAVAVIELGWRRVLPGRAAVVAAAVVGAVTAAAMAAVELSAAGAEVYETLMGALQWPLEAVVAVPRGAGLPEFDAVVQTRDVTDLLTLPAAALPAVWLRADPHRRSSRAGGGTAHGPARVDFGAT